MISTKGNTTKQTTTFGEGCTESDQAHAVRYLAQKGTVPEKCQDCRFRWYSNCVDHAIRRQARIAMAAGVAQWALLCS